jgi:MFS transporter, Spinster family, sphingosine-1-phosphate transporter
VIGNPPAEKSLRQARLALALLLGINLFNYVDRSILYSVQESIRLDFGVSSSAMGWLVLAFLVTYMLLSPVFGFLADRFSRWLLIGIGVTLWSLASGASGLAQSYAALLATRCLIGVGEAAYGPVAPTIISDLYPVAVRGKVLAWFYAAIPIGSAIGYVLGSPFAHAGKWHRAFFLTLPPGLLLGAWCFFKKDPRRGAADFTPSPGTPAFGSEAQARRGEGRGEGHDRKGGLADYKVLAKIPSYVLNTAAMTAMTFAIGGVADWMPTYLTVDRHMTPERAGLFFGGIVASAGLVATLAGGIAGDRLRSRIPGSYFLVSALGMLAGFPLFLLLLITPFPLAWFVLFAAVFCLFFNTGPSNTALANTTPPEIRASAFAINILVIHTLGDAISPGIIGKIRDHYSLNLGFVAVSGMMLIGGLFWLWGMKYLAEDTRAAPTLLQ